VTDIHTDGQTDHTAVTYVTTGGIAFNVIITTCNYYMLLLHVNQWCIRFGVVSASVTVMLQGGEVHSTGDSISMCDYPLFVIFTCACFHTARHDR